MSVTAAAKTMRASVRRNAKSFRRKRTGNT